MDCIAHGVANSQTRLTDFHFTFTFVDLQYIFTFLKFQKKHVYDNRFKQYWQAYGKVNVIDFYFFAQVYSKGFIIYLFRYMPYLYKYICRYLFTQHCITFFTMTCNFPFSCVLFFFWNVYDSPHEAFTVTGLSIGFSYQLNIQKYWQNSH